MFIRCRNTLSGHEASLPVEVVDLDVMPAWVPLNGATPTDLPEDPTYNTAPPKKSATSDTKKEN